MDKNANANTNVKRDKFKISIPELYPTLRKNLELLDEDDDKFKGIGHIAANLIKSNEISIYKVLYNKENISINLHSNEKAVRNEVLKKFVISNEEYFPRELLQDKYQRRTDISYEDQLKEKLSHIIEKNKSKKPRKNKNNENVDISRKDSAADMCELSKKKVFDEKNKEDNKENDYVVNNNEEQEEEKDEENEEEPSYEEDYRMESEGDNVDESDGGNFSDGGVF
jgi:hypothetical protein